MVKRKPFNRKETLEKTAKKLNTSRTLTLSGAAVIGVAGVMSVAKLSKAKTTVEVNMALCELVGGILGGFAVGLAGKKINAVMMKKLIGKPRVCRKIANDIKNPHQRMLIRTLGHVDWKNQSIRTSFRKWYLKKNASQMEINIAKRAIKAAMKKAQYDESLFMV
jgi:hypothetical protein